MTAEKDVDDEDPLKDLVLGEETIEGGSDPYGDSYERVTPEDLAVLDEVFEELKAKDDLDPVEIARIRAQLVDQLEQTLAAAIKIGELHVARLIQDVLECLRR